LDSRSRRFRFRFTVRVMEKPEWFETTDALSGEPDSLDSAGFGASRLAKRLAFVGAAVVIAGTGLAFASTNSGSTQANFSPKPTSTPHPSAGQTKHESTTLQTAAPQTSTPTRALATPRATSARRATQSRQSAIGSTARPAIAGGAASGDDGDNEVNDN
jgi:hypothetical protein